MTDVRCVPTGARCGTANDAGPADYSGEVGFEYGIRFTDHFNGVAPGGGTDPATMQDDTFSSFIPCAQTASTATGSTCSVYTSYNAVTPGMIKDTKRLVEEICDAHVFDGGADGLASTTGDNTVFLRQGIFIQNRDPRSSSTQGSNVRPRNGHGSLQGNRYPWGIDARVPGVDVSGHARALRLEIYSGTREGPRSCGTGRSRRVSQENVEIVTTARDRRPYEAHHVDSGRAGSGRGRGCGTTDGRGGGRQQRQRRAVPEGWTEDALPRRWLYVRQPGGLRQLRRHGKTILEPSNACEGHLRTGRGGVLDARIRTPTG